jgi:hypothetical protein
MTSNAARTPDHTNPEWARYADAIRLWLENDVRNPVLYIFMPGVVETSWSNPYGIQERRVVRLDRYLFQAPCPWTGNPAVYRWWCAIVDDGTGTVAATTSAIRVDAGDYWTRVEQAYGSDATTWPQDLRWARRLIGWCQRANSG